MTKDIFRHLSFPCLLSTYTFGTNCDLSSEFLQTTFAPGFIPYMQQTYVHICVYRNIKQLYCAVPATSAPFLPGLLLPVHQVGLQWSRYSTEPTEVNWGSQRGRKQLKKIFTPFSPMNALFPSWITFMLSLRFRTNIPQHLCQTSNRLGNRENSIPTRIIGVKMWLQYDGQCLR